MQCAYIDIYLIQVSFTDLMHCVEAVFFRRIIRSWVTVWLLCGVDSGSWQQALLNMNDFLCCRPGLWYLSALHPSLLCHSLHLSPTVSLQPTSPPSTHALPPLSPSLCPLAHFPQWLGPESHDVSLDLQVNPSPKASWVPSHLPLFPSPFLWLSLGTATHTPVPVDPSDPHGTPLGLILVTPGRG